jgi:hypothetical protein
MKKWIQQTGLILLLTGPALTANATVTVTNVTASQRPGTKLVDIGYDVSCTETNQVKVTVEIKDGASTVTSTSLSGAVGTNVITGTGKQIVWNMGTDWDGNISTNIKAYITADIRPDGGDSNAVAWAVINDRWVKNTYANGDITMGDRQTGRMWLYNATSTNLWWQQGVDYCNNLTYAGYSDWRLPDSSTLQGQYSQTGFFQNVPTGYSRFWSSSTAGAFSGYAWFVEMSTGKIDQVLKTGGANIWPVRN